MDIKDMRRGDWMSGNVKPEAPGVYEREYPCGSILLSNFNNGLWYAWAFSPEYAAEITINSSTQNLPWRGQLEYDPHNAPDGFVAEPGKCRECDLYKVEFLCKAANCVASKRFDGMHVIMKRAKTND